MSNAFESPGRKLARAKDHIQDFERKTKAFFDSGPCTQITEPDPDSGYRLFKVRFNRPLPGSLADIAADAVENMRNVLDHAGYATAVISGRVKPLNAYFPFGGSPADFENNMRGRCKDIPDQITALFRALQPYKGGNNLLWALNRIAVTNKHRLLAPLVLSAGGLSFSGVVTGSATKPLAIGGRPTWDRTKNEVTYLRVPADATLQGEFKVFLTVTFDEVEIVSGQPALNTLNRLVGEVERILIAIEAETRRLFPSAFV